jgi:isopenicillin N synthase-like dioxygenase
MASSDAETIHGNKTIGSEGVVPIVDFSSFRSERSLKTGKELFAAFKDSGFVYLQNHGVPQDVLDEAFAWVRATYPFPV